MYWYRLRDHIKIKGSRGFTLLETLVVVGLAAILAAVVTIAAVSINNTIQQSRLDTIAQDIYIAVQDRLTEVYTDDRIDMLNPDALAYKNSGRSDLYQLAVKNGATVTPIIPGDWELADSDYTILTSLANTSASVSYKTLLPAGSLADEVYNGAWIIEYSPDFGYVYAVYYADSFAAFNNITTAEGWYAEKEDGVSYADAYRGAKSNRKNSGIGYYGGGGVTGQKVKMTNTALNLTLDVENAEKLTATISVKVPTEYREYVVEVNYTIKGATSGATVTNTIYMDSASGNYGYYTRQEELTIDSLNDRFSAPYREFIDFIPGEDLIMTASAQIGTMSGPTFFALADTDGASDSTTFNSLYESIDAATETVYVAYGRHLQNLDSLPDDSRLVLTKAVQTKSIDFTYETAGDDSDTSQWWAESYATAVAGGSKVVRTFTPVTNSKLDSYDGGSYTITGLTASDTDAGLFGNFTGSTIKNTFMISAVVNGTNAGALAGTVTGDVTLDNCGAYLARADYYKKTYNSITTKIIGSENAGGLVGLVNGNVTAKNGTFAAEVVNSATDAESCAGGLFGKVTGAMTVESSYADCYIAGHSIGGLAGSCGAGSSISASYAAGFTVNNNAAFSAGFVPSAVDSAKNSYTIFSLGTDYLGATKYATVAGASAEENFYYIGELLSFENATAVAVGSSTSYSNLKSTTVGGADPEVTFDGGFSYEPNTSRTTAYNLAEGLGLTVYPYPTISAAAGVVRHYGDWDGAAFEPGTLVYFEEYLDAEGNVTRGYYGAGRNYLRDDLTIIKDGYALLYLADDRNFAEGQTVGSGEFCNVEFGAAEVDDYQEFNVLKRSIIITTDPDDPDAGVVASAGTAAYLFRDIDYSVLNAAEAAVGTYYTLAGIELTYEGITNTYYYYLNPHFAASEVQVELEEDGSVPEAPLLADTTDNAITVRTARQLKLLSEHYYRADSAVNTKVAFDAAVTIEQELPIDLRNYQWTAAGYSERVTEIKPIAASSACPFNATYNGMNNPITGTNVMSLTLHTGLFGVNDGTIKNTVIAAESAENLLISYTNAPDKTNSTANSGGIAAINNGTIENCAAAGYRLQVYTYNSTTLNAGGLVGINNGTIKNCSAEMPGILVEANSSNASIGLFVGRNGGTGTILNSFSVGDMSVKRFTAGTVRAGGFAGTNGGIIQNSYTAASMTVSNIEAAYVDGFAPSGGTVRLCYFLSDGSYRFIDEIRSYEQTSKTATAVNYQQLSGTAESGNAVMVGFGAVTAENSSFHGATNLTESAAYPFVSSVKNENGAVYYGDWVTEDILGNTGLVYWEHEEKGANNGYHFYIVSETGTILNTLCEAHDDKGVITEYGYGTYKLNGYNTTEPAYSNVITGSANAAAAAAISEQFADVYTFTLYTTMDAFGATDNTKLHLKQNGNYSQADTSYATLTYNNKTYYFNPFFAAAARLSDSLDGAAVGSESLPFQIRSIGQLQYINWNGKTATANQLVSGSNYRYFTYLGQTSFTTTATQGRNNANNPAALGWVWRQSHDIDMTGVSVSFTPIAGAATTSSSDGYNAILYAWFGGKYDGQSYKIQEMNIDSKSYTVGLFGVAAGAQLENIIMYSEKGAVISRTTSASDGAGAYTIGGLAGVAYDYNTASGYSVTNCAIAGYRIIDNSKNQQTLGEANVGGLIGVSNISIDKCSAVVDIEVNATHKNGSTFTKAAWGNYIRVGGIAGGVMRSVTNSYSGGSITVGSALIDENYSGSIHISQTSSNYVNRNDSSNVYLAGIGGSGFAMNFTNFTNDTSLKEGSPEFANCYTYMEFPGLEGTIRSISIIGSIADRYAQTATVKITNCYYLDNIINREQMLKNAPTFYLYGNSSTYNVSKAANTYFDRMINGSSSFVNYYMQGALTNKVSGTISLTSKDFDGICALAPSLGSAFGTVTTTENGSNINGKYSFPANGTGLNGLNYPFPTVITQPDNTFNRTVNVHYGLWPKSVGLYSSAATVDLDILKTESYMGEAVLSYYNDYTLTSIPSADDVTLLYAEEEDAGTSATSRIVSVEKVRNNDGTVALRIKGLKEGSSTITATYNNYSVQIQVTVNAEFSIDVEPVTVEFVKNDKGTEIYAIDATDNTTVFQREELYWELTAINSVGLGLDLTDQNWSVRGTDNEYDDYTIMVIRGEDGEDHVILSFNSIKVGNHELQLYARNIKNISGQTIDGVRTTNVTCTILKTPNRVTVFADSEDAANNTILTSFYIGPDGYYTDKHLTDKAPGLEIPEARENYDFRGYAFIDGTMLAKAGETDADGKLSLIHSDSIYFTGTDYTAYAKWVPLTTKLILSYTNEAGTDTVEESFTMIYGEAADDTLAENYDSANFSADEGYEVNWYTALDNGVYVLSANGRFTDNAVTEGLVDTDGNWIYADDTELRLYGVAEEIRYYVHYDLNYSDAEPVADTVFLYSATGDTALAADPVRANCTFDGWFTEAAGGDAITAVNKDSGFNANHELTVYAHWTGNPYTVTYDANGGTFADGVVTTLPVAYTEPYGALLDENAVTNGNLIFSGWWTSADDSGYEVTAETNVDIADDHTLYAHWNLREFDVTFDVNGGNALASGEQTKHVVYETAYGTLPAVTRTGYNFAGWFTEAEGGSAVTAETVVIAIEAHTLYAHWEAKTSTVTFDVNGGNALAASEQTKTITYDQTFGTLPAATRENADFLGWFTSKVSGTQITEDTPVTTTSNRTLYAHWKLHTVTVTFDSNGGSEVADVDKTRDVMIGGAYGTMPADPTRTGYNFAGWFTEKDGGTQVTAVTNVTNEKNHTLYARWTAKTFTITFNGNGGTYGGNRNYKTNVNPVSKTVTYGELYGELATATRTKQDNTKDGEFLGWYTATTGGTLIGPGSTVQITSNTTLYAHWRNNNGTYITFDKNADDATGVMAVQFIAKNQSANLTANAFTRPGYTFSGWSTTAGGSKSYNDGASYRANNTNATTPVTLYAVWTPTPYTITLNANGGTLAAGAKSSFTATLNSKYGAAYGNGGLPTATRGTGYVFDGWYTAANGGEEVTNDTYVTTMSNHSIYVHWFETWILTFNAVDGTPAQQTLYSANINGDAVAAVTMPTRNYYTMTGWYTADGTKVLEADGTVADQEVAGYTAGGMLAVNADRTLNAQWVPTEYTISYVTNGGVISAENTEVTDNLQRYTVETAVTLAVPTRTGYTFNGWAVTNSDGAVNWNTAYAAGTTNIGTGHAGNVTLTAQWTVIDYVITYDPNGGTVTAAENMAVDADNKQIFTVEDENGLTLATAAQGGFEFRGWKVTSENDGTWVKDTIFTPEQLVQTGNHGNVTLTAQWSDPIGYTITYKIYRNNDNGASTISYDATMDITLATPATRDGLAFAGWVVTSESDGSWTKDHLYEANTLANPEALHLGLGNYGNVVLTAKWTWKIHFVDPFNAAASMADLVLEDGASGVLTLNNFTRTGYEFTGWNTSTDGTGTPYANGAKVIDEIPEDNTDPVLIAVAVALRPEGNVNLYAQWAANNYSVVYNSNDGTGRTAPQAFTYDAAQNLMANPFAKTGYNEAGLNTAADGSGTGYDFGDEVMNLTAEKNGTVNLYVQWTPIHYTVIFNSNIAAADGSMANQAFAYDEVKNLNAVGFTKTGYTFDHWSTVSDEAAAAGTSYADGAAVSNLTATDNAEVALYAQWKVNNYKVRFNANGGTGTMADQSFTYDAAAAALTANAFTKAGYHFMGWSLTAGGVKAYDNAEEVRNLTGTADGIFTLYAVWEANSYNVSFNANGGNGTMADEEFTYDVEKALTGNTFTRSGYKFLGWSKSVTATTATYTDGQSIKNLTTENGGTVMLYAVWEMNKLTLSASSASTNKSQTFSSNIVGVTALTGYRVPVRSGWELVGWYTTKTGTGGIKVLNADGSVATASVTGYTNADGRLELTSDRTLYARWKMTIKRMNAVTGDPVNGTYVITSSDNTKLLKRTSTSAVGTANTNSVDTSWYTSTGGAASAGYYVSDADLTSVSWVKNASTLKNGNYYLYRNNNSIGVRTSSYSWGYISSSYIYDHESSGFIWYTYRTYSVYYNNTSFAINSESDEGFNPSYPSPKNVYFYTVTDEEVYSYD